MANRNLLTPKQKTEISGAMHIEFLRLFMLKTRFTIEDIVFHGGTSLKILHGSPRYSEDLDFMISARVLPEIDASCERVSRAVGAAMKAQIPGVRVAWRPKGVKDRMLSGFLVAENRAWIGNVKVKIECYTAHDMSKYLATNMMLDPGTVVPTGTLESILGDKIVALAMRPYFKERDVFDVWWLLQRGARPDPSRIEASSAVYGYEMNDVLQGLETLEDRLPDTDQIEQSLSRWLPAQIVDHFRAARVFDELRGTVLDVRDNVLSMAPDE